MPINRYDAPVQTQFINTYVPLPFEQLYALGQQAKESVNNTLQFYNTKLDEWGNFQSPSEVDIRSWNDETFGRIEPVAEELSRNVDLLKTPEGRARIYSTINSVDRNKLNALQQSAENLRTRQKIDTQLMLQGLYNPEWHYIDYANYNTLGGDGIFSNLSPTPYKSEIDLVRPFVDDLKPEAMGSDGRYLYSGISEDRVRHQVDANLSSILNSPQAKEYINAYMNRGMDRNTAESEFIKDVYTAANEFAYKNRTGVDTFALEQMRYNRALDLQRLKNRGKTGRGSGNGSDDTLYPDIYSRIMEDNNRSEIQSIYMSDIFNNSRARRNESNEKLLEIEDLVDNYKAGKISEEDFKKQYEAATKAYTEYENKRIKDGVYSDAYKQDIAEYFNRIGGTIEIDSEELTPKQLSKYNAIALRVADGITYSMPEEAMMTYNKQKSTNEITVNYNNTEGNGFISPSSKGMVLTPEFIQEIADKRNPNLKFMVEDNSGNYRNFGEDLKTGVFKNIIKLPYSTGMNVQQDGISKIAQRLRIMIPEQSILEVGYTDFDKMVKNMYGENNIVKDIQVKEYDEGSTASKPTTLTGKYYVFDVMETINNEGTDRTIWDQNTNKTYGGTTLQNSQYGGSLMQSYPDDDNDLNYYLASPDDDQIITALGYN